MVPNETVFLSKLSDIDKDIRKFDSVNSVQGVTSLSEVDFPTDYSCPQSLKGNQNSAFPFEPYTINQKENLGPQVLCDITNTKSSPNHAAHQGK